MEGLAVGMLTSLTVMAGAVFWELQVHPEVFLSLWVHADAEEEWMAPQARAVRALRWVSGALVLVLGFLTGLALTFLSGTA